MDHPKRSTPTTAYGGIDSISQLGVIAVTMNPGIRRRHMAAVSMTVLSLLPNTAASHPAKTSSKREISSTRLMAGSSTMQPTFVKA